MDLIESDGHFPESQKQEFREELPSDPNDDYYLINCFVCQEVAKPGQVRRSNFPCFGSTYFKMTILSCRIE
jgi:hypothetical protein